MDNARSHYGIESNRKGPRKSTDAEENDRVVLFVALARFDRVANKRSKFFPSSPPTSISPALGCTAVLKKARSP